MILCTLHFQTDYDMRENLDDDDIDGGELAKFIRKPSEVSTPASFLSTVNRLISATLNVRDFQIWTISRRIMCAILQFSTCAYEH